jgi:hypothetical protein
MPFLSRISGSNRRLRRRVLSGDGEIRVPAADGTLTYVAPNLIYQYLVAHQYLPPDVFRDALAPFHCQIQPSSGFLSGSRASTIRGVPSKFCRICWTGYCEETNRLFHQNCVVLFLKLLMS